MISFDEAYRRVTESALPLGSENVGLVDALGRVLAEDITSDINMPPFNKSAMDGYACRRVDLPGPLKVVDIIPAGHMPKCCIGSGECSKIMTGAPTPNGADCVMMIERVAEASGDQVSFTTIETSDNICMKGEDVNVGDVVLEQGEMITPAHIAVLAAVGCVTVPVSRRPVVTVMATGSELVEPSSSATGASIRNSNSYQLCAQLTAMGCDARYYGIVEDSIEATDAAVKAAMADTDLLLLSGGVSTGDFDFVPGVLKANGFEFAFDSVAMKPGRPTVFGSCGDVFCCGLPGNPVSTFVITEILLKPFLYRMMGHNFEHTFVAATLDKTVRRHKTKRQSTLPVAFIAPDRVALVEYHGSGHINAICKADALLTIPAGQAEITEGTIVNVRLM